MSEFAPPFKRMVVGLPPSAGDYAAVGAAAMLAELLRLPLVATFADDRTLFDVAGLSCVRELRTAAGGWHAIDVMRLAQEAESAADIARRMFDQVVGRRRIEWRFDLARDSIARLIGSLAGPDDIIAVIEPKNPVDRITQQFSQLLDAVFKTPASVMMVPSRPIRTSGPIVVVAETADEPSVAIARALATAGSERLFVVTTTEATLATPAERSRGEERLALKLATPLHLADLSARLPPVHERLLIVSRRLVLTDASRVSFSGAPVLIVKNRRQGAD